MQERGTERLNRRERKSQTRERLIDAAAEVFAARGFETATLDEVASWAAWHSKARTAGKVPVHYTLKKYVHKPRGARAGLVYIEREKALLVRPVEPPREQMSDAPPPEPGSEAEE